MRSSLSLHFLMHHKAKKQEAQQALATNKKEREEEWVRRTNQTRGRTHLWFSFRLHFRSIKFTGTKLYLASKYDPSKLSVLLDMLCWSFIDLGIYFSMSYVCNGSKYRGEMRMTRYRFDRWRFWRRRRWYK